MSSIVNYFFYGSTLYTLYTLYTLKVFLLEINVLLHCFISFPDQAAALRGTPWAFTTSVTYHQLWRLPPSGLYISFGQSGVRPQPPGGGWLGFLTMDSGKAFIGLHDMYNIDNYWAEDLFFVSLDVNKSWKSCCLDIESQQPSCFYLSLARFCSICTLALKASVSSHTHSDCTHEPLKPKTAGLLFLRMWIRHWKVFRCRFIQVSFLGLISGKLLLNIQRDTLPLVWTSAQLDHHKSLHQPLEWTLTIFLCQMDSLWFAQREKWSSM